MMPSTVELLRKMQSPLSVAPEHIDRHYKIDPHSGEPIEDEALSEIRDAMAVASETGKKIVASHGKITANPLQTPLANARQARDMALSHFNGVAKRMDAARERAKRTVTELEKKMAPQPPKDLPGNIGASELRAALANMPPARRQATIDAAIAEGDEALVNAALTGHPLTTGLSRNEMRMHELNWRRTRFPEEVERIGRITRALDDLGRGGQDFLNFCYAFDTPAIREAEEAERAAKQATSGEAA
jgi:hypothetical protein